MSEEQQERIQAQQSTLMEQFGTKIRQRRTLRISPLTQDQKNQLAMINNLIHN